MRWLITETVEYLVHADTREEAEALFLENGPEVSVDEGVEQLGVSERRVEPADT
jgi:hypothetical protein